LNDRQALLNLLLNLSPEQAGKLRSKASSIISQLVQAGVPETTAIAIISLAIS